MHSLEALELYAQFHPRWFEGVERYNPSGEYREIASALLPKTWEFRRTGLWYSADPPARELPESGWKLHVSVSTRDCAAALERALPVLLEQKTSFKFLLDGRIASLVNSKLWPRGSSGKFLTVYPRSTPEFRETGELLAKALDGFSGPYILSDRRWPGSSCVHYRYGGFAPLTRLEPDGRRQHLLRSPAGDLVPDIRAPYWSPPEWVTDPFGEEEAPSGSGKTAFADGRFAITSALGFSNRGGVYKGLDHQTGREVVLKEARPRVELGSSSLEAVAVLEKEFRLLERLAGTGYFVQPVAFFRAWEHAFLVEEWAPGGHLGVFSIRNNPIYSTRVTADALDSYLGKMKAIWLQVAEAIAAAHDRNVVLGDLSFTNILVGEDGAIRICDLETAVEQGVDAPVGLHTVGMSRTGADPKANDYHALGALIFGSILLAHSAAGFHTPLRRRIVGELASDLDLPGSLTDLIDVLTGQNGHVEPATIKTAIERLPVNGDGVKRGPPRLALEMARRVEPPKRMELEARAVEAKGEIVRYLRGTADVSRQDRLCPADLFVFETNPLSVAYGAAGIVYALQRLTGEVPPEFLQWMSGHRITNEDYPPGLYVGQAGIGWVLYGLGMEERAIEIMRQARHHPVLLQSAGVLHGAAGYGLCCLKLWSNGAGDEFLAEAVRVGEHLKEKAVIDERGARWPNEDGSVYLGYAHGGSGIALFLLYLGLASRETEWLRLGREALDYELAQGVWLGEEFGGFPSRVAPSGRPEESPVLSCYWDAGSAGTGTTLVRFLSVMPEARYRDWLERLVADTARKYTVFPQLFRGLAGLGNFLLDAWQYSGDENHLLSAWHAAEGVLLFGIEREEGLTFPGEQAKRESGDFATGGAGIGLFLDRLLQAGRGDAPNFNFVVDELLPGGVERVV